MANEKEDNESSSSDSETQKYSYEPGESRGDSYNPSSKESGGGTEKKGHQPDSDDGRPTWTPPSDRDSSIITPSESESDSPKSSSSGSESTDETSSKSSSESKDS